MVSKSSYHAPYDHCTAKYLDQAGFKNTFLRLEDQGIRGNGHMMMLEKNNLELSAFIPIGKSQHPLTKTDRPQPQFQITPIGVWVQHGPKLPPFHRPR